MKVRFRVGDSVVTFEGWLAPPLQRAWWYTVLVGNVYFAYCIISSLVGWPSA